MIVFTAAHAAYGALRFPSLLAERALLNRLPADNPVRLAVAKVLGTADQVAGRLLGAPDVANRGQDATDRAAAVADAGTAFAAPAQVSTSALLPEIAPPAPAAVAAAADNDGPPPLMTAVPTAPEQVQAAVAAINAVHHAAAPTRTGPPTPAGRTLLSSDPL